MTCDAALGRPSFLGWRCTLSVGHRGDHEAWTSIGLLARWADDNPAASRAAMPPVMDDDFAALLRDLPPVGVGFDSEEARDAWLTRKRELLQRIVDDGGPS